MVHKFTPPYREVNVDGIPGKVRTYQDLHKEGE